MADFHKNPPVSDPTHYPQIAAGVRDTTKSSAAHGQSQLLEPPEGSWRRSSVSPGKLSIVAVERPGYFAYRLWNFGSYMRHFVREARGQWWFQPLPSGATEVRWTYTFDLASPLVAPLLLPFVNLFYRRYMRNAMDRTKAQVEAGAPAAASSRRYRTRRG